MYECGCEIDCQEVAKPIVKISVVNFHFGVVQRFVAFQYELQGSIVAKYLDEVTKTVATMSELATFTDTTKADRLKLWAHIFDINPLATVLAVYKILAPGVPFEDIYSGRSAIHIKWMQFIKTTFCFFADDTYELRVLNTDKKSRDICYGRWRALPCAPVFASLGLGTLADVPVKSGGPLDQGRRNRVEKVTYDKAHVLMVSGYCPATTDRTDLVQPV